MEREEEEEDFELEDFLEALLPRDREEEEEEEDIPLDALDTRIAPPGSAAFLFRASSNPLRSEPRLAQCCCSTLEELEEADADERVESAADVLFSCMLPIPPLLTSMSCLSTSLASSLASLAICSLSPKCTSSNSESIQGSWASAADRWRSRNSW